MHASYAALYKIVYIFLNNSMLCMHPMQPFINLYKYESRLCMFSFRKMTADRQLYDRL